MPDNFSADEALRELLRGSVYDPNYSAHDDTARFSPDHDLPMEMALGFALAGSRQIRADSWGEIATRAIFVRGKVELHPRGLFSEEIFGPSAEWTSPAGPAPGRFGHIELPRPVFHPLFLGGPGGELVARLLRLSPSGLQDLIEGRRHVVVSTGAGPWEQGAVITAEEAATAVQQFGVDFQTRTHAAGAAWLLERADPHHAIAEADDRQIARQMRALGSADASLRGLVLDVLPVVPVSSRPIYFNRAGKARMADANHLYRSVLYRCEQLRKLDELKAPLVLVADVTRRLQRAVNELFLIPSTRTTRRGKTRRLKPLAAAWAATVRAMARPNFERTYPSSIRAPLVPNPRLDPEECGLPQTVDTLKLFRSQLAAQLQLDPSCPELLDQRLNAPDAALWRALDRVLTRSAVLLLAPNNRGQSAVRAFRARLTAGEAIQISPLAMRTLAGEESWTQATALVLHEKHAASEARLGVIPEQAASRADQMLTEELSPELIWGIYRLTRDTAGCDKLAPRAEGHGGQADGRVFASIEEVVEALERGRLQWHTRVVVRAYRLKVAQRNLWDTTFTHFKRIETTAGRVLVNSVLPKYIPFLNYPLGGKQIRQVLRRIHEGGYPEMAAPVLRRLEKIALETLTRSGASVGLADLAVPSVKAKVMEQVARRDAQLIKLQARGVITLSDQLNGQWEAWSTAVETIWQAVAEQITSVEFTDSSLATIYRSGAASVLCSRRLLGIIGLRTNTRGALSRTLAASSWSEGLPISNYWPQAIIERHIRLGDRMRQDQAQRLSRQLRKALRPMHVTMADCGCLTGTTPGVDVGIVKHTGERASDELTIYDLAMGRVMAETISHPVTGEVIVKANELVTKEIADRLDALGILNVRVRSPVTCQAPDGVCQQCFGLNRATGELVEVGAAVGLISAIAITEDAHELVYRPGGRSSSQTRQDDNGEAYARYPGKVCFDDLETTEGEESQRVALYAGRIKVVDHRERELQSVDVPVGARVFVADGEDVAVRALMATWDPAANLCVAHTDGIVRVHDVREGINYRRQADGQFRLIQPQTEDASPLRPCVTVSGPSGKPREVHYLPLRTTVTVEDGTVVLAGQTLATTWVHRWSDRLRVNFEDLARLVISQAAPKPTPLAPAHGVITQVNRTDKGHQVLFESDQGDFREFLIEYPHWPRLHAGCLVEAGEPLVRNAQIEPRELLMVFGPTGAAQRWVSELRRVFLEHNEFVDDQHLELLARALLHRVVIESGGDTGLYRHLIVKRAEFERENRRIETCVVIVASEVPEFAPGQVFDAEYFRRRAETLAAAGRPVPRVAPARRATARPRWSNLLMPVLGLVPGFLDFRYSPTGHLAKLALTQEQLPLVCRADRVILGVGEVGDRPDGEELTTLE